MGSVGGASMAIAGRRRARQRGGYSLGRNCDSASRCSSRVLGKHLHKRETRDHRRRCEVASRRATAKSFSDRLAQRWKTIASKWLKPCPCRFSAARGEKFLPK